MVFNGVMPYKENSNWNYFSYIVAILILIAAGVATFILSLIKANDPTIEDIILQPVEVEVEEGLVPAEIGPSGPPNVAPPTVPPVVE